MIRRYALRHFPGRERDAAYQVVLMDEVGLVEGKMLRAQRGVEDFLLFRMTWDGHDFLDAIRDDTVWKKTKSRFASAAKAMTFDLVKSVATATAKEMLGL